MYLKSAPTQYSLCELTSSVQSTQVTVLEREMSIHHLLGTYEGVVLCASHDLMSVPHYICKQAHSGKPNTVSNMTDDT